MDDCIIYVATHKKIKRPKRLSNIYKYIVCGASIGNLGDSDYFYDDFEDNISKMNLYYSELTGLYWIWKHSSSDIIGLAHYRRFLLSPHHFRPLNKFDIEKILRNNDIILPKKIVLKRGVKNELFRFVKTEYFKIIEEKVIEYDSSYKEYFEDFFSGNSMYICNMFIAKRELINSYFEWLFSILFLIGEEIVFDESNKRVMGYISEWLFNIWINKNVLKTYECKMLFVKNDKSIKDTIVKLILGD